MKELLKILSELEGDIVELDISGLESRDNIQQPSAYVTFYYAPKAKE